MYWRCRLYDIYTIYIHTICLFAYMAYVPPHRRVTTVHQYVQRPSTVVAYINLQDATMRTRSTLAKLQLVRQLVRDCDCVFLSEVILETSSSRRGSEKTSSSRRGSEIPEFMETLRNALRNEFGNKRFDYFKTQYYPSGRHGIFLIAKAGLFVPAFDSVYMDDAYTAVNDEDKGTKRRMAVKHTRSNYIVTAVHLKSGYGRENERKRKKAVDEIVSAFGGRSGVILGDFNAKHTVLDSLMDGTGFKREVSALKRHPDGSVDHYYSKGVVITDAVIPRDYRGVTPISDHPSIRIRIQS